MLAWRFVPESSFLDPRSWVLCLRGVLFQDILFLALSFLDNLGNRRPLPGLRLPRLVCELRVTGYGAECFEEKVYTGKGEVRF